MGYIEGTVPREQCGHPDFFGHYLHGHPRCCYCGVYVDGWKGDMMSWKKLVLRASLGAGVGFLTGGPIGAITGAAGAFRERALKEIGHEAAEDYDKLLAFLGDLSNRTHLGNSDRRRLAMERIRSSMQNATDVDAHGVPKTAIPERRVRFVLESALMELSGDMAEAFDQEPITAIRPDEVVGGSAEAEQPDRNPGFPT